VCWVLQNLKAASLKAIVTRKLTQFVLLYKLQWRVGEVKRLDTATKKQISLVTKQPVNCNIVRERHFRALKRQSYRSVPLVTLDNEIDMAWLKFVTYGDTKVEDANLSSR